MKKYIKGLSILVLMIFSFYYTEKIALYVQNNTPLKKEIITYKNDNSIKYVNAEIDGEYIIPGINGLEVNVDKSYSKMKSYNVFSEQNLIYNQIQPEISINDYKNKIIRKGNNKKNGVSILIDKNNIYVDYLKNININFDYTNKTNYCIKINENDCSNSFKQIVEPTISLNNQNFLKEIDHISKGYIIYIKNDVNLNYINVLINTLKYNNLTIYKLNTHLSENYEL